VTVNSTLQAILAELQSARTAYLAAIAGLSTQITNLHNQVVTIKNDTTANKNLLTTMDGRLTTLVTNSNTLITGSAALLDMLTTSDGRLADIKEDTNSLIFHTTNIEEWNLRELLDPWATDIFNNTTSIDNNLYQLKQLEANYAIPYLENIFNAVNNGVGVNAQLICGDACDRDALPPPGGTTPPADGDLHCQRVQYYISHMRDGLVAVIGVASPGVAITASIAEILLATAAIPGLDVATIPSGLVTGVLSLLGTLWIQKLQTIVDTIDNNYDALVSILHNAETAADGVAAWTEFGNDQFDPITQWDLRGVWNLIGNAIFLNALWDQTTYTWDVSAYDDTFCGTDDGPVTLRTSVQCLTASSPGSLAHQIEDVRPWLPLSNLCSDAIIGPIGWCCREDGYVEGANINTLPREVGFNDDVWYPRRIRKQATAQTIAIYSPTSPVVEITTDWLVFDTDTGNGQRIVGEIGGANFTVEIQRLIAGEWIPL